jgi:DNA modification methylase
MLKLEQLKPKPEAPVDLFGVVRTDMLPKDKAGILAKRFGVVPFSVLDARQGYWQDRKREWIELGIKGEEGRQDTEAANNICSPEWGRGAQSEFYQENDARCGGHGLSESQGRINKHLKEYGAQQTGPNSPYRSHGYKAVPGGGGPNSVRRLAPKDAGRCFGQDLIKGENANFGNAPRIGEKDGIWIGYLGGKRAAVFGRDEAAAKAWLDEKNRTSANGLNVAAEKGYGYAATENAELDEKAQRALGVYAATNGAVQERGGGGVAGTSVFDPVLCECVYKWFSPPGGKILDPFAGESTKGIVAGFLGYQYTGIELRPEQVKANYRQAGIVTEKVKAAIEKVGGLAEEEIQQPTWLNGDSGKLGELLDEHDPFSEGFDFIWTSPPYYDLEIYSESEKDGSAFETYEKFMVWYEDIFRQAVERLKPNRFVAVKIGEIRDDKGFYRNFVGDNISVFRRLGLKYYNEIILTTAIGSLPVRISSQFPSYRKVGKTHQNVLIFYKGDTCKNIPKELGVLAQDSISNEKQQAQLGQERALPSTEVPQ